MNKKQGQIPSEKLPKPSYPLAMIQELVRSGKCWVNADVVKDARNDFGWNISDIMAAMLCLKMEHFYKTEPRDSNPKIFLDFYKAHKIMGEDIYTHFYVCEGKLIINSFKQL